MRLFSTQLLGEIFDRHSTNLEDWGMQILIPLLYDPSEEVAAAALELLSKLIKNPGFVTLFVKNQPDLEHLSNSANQLLLNLLDVPEGLEYLIANDYLQSEFDYWFDYGVFQYVTLVELALQNSSSPEIPPHFYGHLTLTQNGCLLLESAGHLEVFVSIVEDYEMEEGNTEGQMKLKAAIWAIGHIGANEQGIEMLKSSNAIKSLFKIAKSSMTFSLRGTCFSCFNLISSSQSGKILMQTNGWSTRVKNICLPEDLYSYFETPEWQFIGSWPKNQHKTFLPVTTNDSTIEDVLVTLGNLSNPILATSASKKLAALRTEKPGVFMRMDLFVQAMQITSIYSFKIATRRFIADLFDKVVWDKQGLKVIDAMGGLDLCFAMPRMIKAWNSSESVVPVFEESVKERGNVKPMRETLLPSKVVKGFVN